LFFLGSFVLANPGEGRHRQRSREDARPRQLHAALEAENVAGMLEKLYNQQYVCVLFPPLIDTRSADSALGVCCNKFVKVGMVHLLMRIFDRWEKFDGHMRLKICNYALNTLQHLSNTSRWLEIPRSRACSALNSSESLTSRVLLLLFRSRSWKEGHQVEQWPAATVPVLYQLPGGQSLRLPAVACLPDNQSMPGEEGVTGA